MVDLSIITCTIPERAGLMGRLAKEIAFQSKGLPVEHVIVDSDGTIGRKIDAGLRRSKGRYVCVVDDDDEVVHDYISTLLLAIKSSEPPVVTFGIQTPGHAPCWLRTNCADTNEQAEDGSITKLANHLCAWRRNIALSVPCLPRNYGWDVVWYRAIRAAYPDLYEFHISRVLYRYNFDPVKTRAQSPNAISDSMDNNGHRIMIIRLHDGRLAAGPSMDRMWVPGMEKLDLSECIAGRDYVLLDTVEFQ